MVNSHMKGLLTSLVIKEMQRQTTVRYHFTATVMAAVQKMNNKCWEGCKRSEPWYTVHGNVK